MVHEILLDDEIKKVKQRVQDTIRDTFVEREIVEEKDVGSFAGAVKKPRTIKESLYSKVLLELSRGTRNTDEQNRCLNIYETALSVFKVASIELRKYMDIWTLERQLATFEDSLKDRARLDDPTLPDDKMPFLENPEYLAEKRRVTHATFFSNAYAMYLAGSIGLALLGTSPEELKDIKSMAYLDTESKKIADSDHLMAELTRMVVEDMERISFTPTEEEPIDGKLEALLEGTFKAWINQFHWKTFADMIEEFELDDVKLRFGKFSLEKGTFKQKYDDVIVDDKIMNVRAEDVIGHEPMEEDDLKKVKEKRLSNVLDVAFNNLLFYNHERKENSTDPPFIVFTFGNPGGGKTFTAHAYMMSFADQCRELGIPLWLLTHSTTDYASHYQNLTANRLQKLAQDIKEFPGIVVMYVADADNIFLDRRDNLTAEQRQTLAVYFKMFDGTMIPKNGRFMAIMDANFIDNIDPATRSRLFDEIVEMKRWTNPEYFAKLAKRQLSRGADGIPISPKEWAEIGEYILDSGLSNRTVGYVVRGLRGGYKMPLELLKAPWEEQIAYRAKKLEAITKDRVIAAFDNYMATEAEITDNSAHELNVKQMEDKFLQDIIGKPDPSVVSAYDRANRPPTILVP